MTRFRPLALLFAIFALTQSLGGLVAAGADSGSADVLQPVTSTTVTHPVDTTFTPEDYKAMQASAPEALVLRVTSIKTEVGKPADASVSSAPLMVTAQAAVIRVIRSATGLKTGDVIYLLYGYAPPVPGKSSYTPIPVISNNTEYTAYLTGGPKDKNPYRPAASAQSFIDDAAQTANGPAAKPSGPLADPALLPTPDNPSPVGVPRLTRTNLAQFAKAIEKDGHWGVSIAEADPLPLQTTGNGDPVLLAYYPASIHAPATQPRILVYLAGEADANTPAAVSTERALIIDSNGRKLGDVVWAWRVADGQKPPALPVWYWSSYKLEVEDPGTHVVQTVQLDGGGTPPPAQN